MSSQIWTLLRPNANFLSRPMHVALAMAEKHATWSGSGIGNHFCNRGSFAQRRSALRIVMLPAASAMLVQRLRFTPWPASIRLARHRGSSPIREQ